MTWYLISFDDGAMAHIPDDEWPAVGEASHAVVRGRLPVCPGSPRTHGRSGSLTGWPCTPPPR